MKEIQSIFAEERFEIWGVNWRLIVGLLIRFLIRIDIFFCHSKSTETDADFVHFIR